MSDLTILPIKPLQEDNEIKFDPRFFDLNTGGCVLHVAPPKSGKSVLITNLILNPNFDLINKLDIVHIYSPTITAGDQSTRHLYEQMPGTIYKDYSDKHLQSILNQQLSFPKSQRPKIAIFFDDFITFPNLTKNSLVFKLATNYRHFNVKLIYLASQYYKAVPVSVRSCINYAIIGRNSNKKELDKMNEELGSVYDNQFLRLHKQATNDPYSFLYLRLYDNPSATAYKNFTTKIYTSKQNGQVDIDGDEFYDDDDE